MGKKVNFSLLAIGTALSLVGTSVPVFAATNVNNNINKNQTTNSAIVKIIPGYIPNGVIVKTPPKGWNPLKANSAKLKEYGIPLRPTKSSALKKWEMAIGDPNWVSPSFGTSNLKADSQSTNWSGVIQNSYSSRVVGWWNQPWAYAPTSDRPAYSCTWVGMGGTTSTAPLVQAGVDSNINTNGSGQYNLWYEIVHTTKNTSYEVPVSGLNNQPGDQIYIDISWTVNPSTNLGSANFYVHDLTNNNALSFAVSGIGNYAGINSSSEWITERTTVSGSLWNMPDYNTVNWKGEWGNPSTLYYPGGNNVQYEWISESNSNSTPLSVIGNYLNSTGNFSTVWKNYN